MSEEKDPAQAEQTSATPSPAPHADGAVPSGEIMPRPGDNGPSMSAAPAAEARAPRPAEAPKNGWLAWILGRKPAPQPASTAPGTPQPKHHDIYREVAETVVFVVVLVLMLKTFIAEAFVIPTGSMATTLWGYQKIVECDKCKFTFPVNCSSQMEPPHTPVTSCVCPNCRHFIRLPSADNPKPNNGDRVLVSKFLYDSGVRQPSRYDVVVFKYPGKLRQGPDGRWEISTEEGKSPPEPDGPQKFGTAMNYIKRLIGLPGETIGIHGGKLYVAEGVHYDDSGVPPETLRRFTHTSDSSDTPENQEVSRKLLEQFRSDVTRPADSAERKFHILRKPPKVLLALSRPVYDNDFQASDLSTPRWYAPQGWKSDDAQFPRRFTAEPTGDSVNWLRYRNLLRNSNGELDPKPQRIEDFLGYNVDRPGTRWVGDLIIETEVKLDKAAKGDELWLELARGVDRFQARFNLENGNCTLVRLTKPGNQEQVLAQKDTTLKAPGTYKVRFANVDERLTLWINDAMPFGDGQIYDPPKVQGYDTDADDAKNNDLNPVAIGVKGAPGLSVAHLKLSRDTYYGTYVSGESDFATFYVQPKHYLCLGDNSMQSKDGRDWGLVPDRLLLGRALMVYFPFKLPFDLFGLDNNRTGMIE
jgi:signal peptidase I